MSEIRDKQGTKSAAIDATVTSLISPVAVPGSPQSISTTASVALRRGGVGPQDYVFSGVVGRCFLRVCFWIEVFTGWKKKYQPVEFTFGGTKRRNLPTQTLSILEGTASGGALSVQSTLTAALPSVEHTGA